MTKDFLIKNINNFTNIYVLSDIHGCLDKFIEMLNLIKLKPTDLLIVDGDVIDRGNDGIILLKKILDMENVFLLKGNHEDMMYTSMTGDYGTFDLWLKYNGGTPTYKALMSLPQTERTNLLNIINNLPLYISFTLGETEFLIVHAGIEVINNFTLEECLKVQSEDNFLWIRKEFLKSKNKHPYKIIFGHTQTRIIPYEINGYPNYYNYKCPEYNELKIKKDLDNSKIWHSDNNNKIGIDCAVCSGGKLSCIRLNDMREFYV